MNAINQKVLDEASKSLKDLWCDAKPRLGIVLGSGWGEAISDFEVEKEIGYEQIPGFGKTGVAGHAGKLLLAKCGENQFFIFQGRRHFYEGEGWTPVVLPVWLLKQFGAESVLLTNASGGIRDDLGPGSLVAIEDHINMFGANPLQGPHNPQLGVRFPDQTKVYCPELNSILQDVGANASGVYLATAGPTFETPAEIRAFRAMGADVVGMSTVPEAIVANALSLRVAGLSCVCNWAAGLGHKELTHEDVGRAAAEAMPRMREVLKEFVLEVC